MRIAITGANGFIGNNLLKHFKACGHETIAIIRKSAIVPDHDVEIREVDYYDALSLTENLKDVDVLIHNAGKTKSLNAQEMLAANVGITQRIVQAINTLNHPIHLIFISSQAASRASTNNKPINEDETPRPLTRYGKSKLYAERLIQKQCIKDWTIVRPCSVYGAGDKDFLALFKIIKLGFSIQLGKKDRLLNMIHVSELLQFITLLCKNPVVYSQILFATDGRVYKQSQVIEFISHAMHKKTRIIQVPVSVVKAIFSISDTLSRATHRSSIINKEKEKEILADGWLADVSKAKLLIGWETTNQIEKHIQETLKWYQENGWL